MIEAFIALGVLTVLSIPTVAVLIHDSMMATVLIETPVLVISGAVLGARLARNTTDKFQQARTWFATPAITLAVCLLGFWMLPITLDAAGASTATDFVRHVTLFGLCGLPLGATWSALNPVAQSALVATGIGMVGMMGLVQISYSGRLCSLYVIEEQRLLGRVLLALTPMLTFIWFGMLISRRGART